MADCVVEYEPRLVEEAVLRALGGRAEETAFRKEFDGLYEITDPEARDAGFRAFHAAWFKRLGLGSEIVQALQERPSVATKTDRCVVASALSGPDEGGELFVSSGNGTGEARRRAVVLRLRPETLMLHDRLRFLLRHELLHIEDMLDPRFGYEPRLPVSAAGPIHEQLLRDRYRVLWDAFIDGRLARLGWAPAGIRDERLNDFARAFPMVRERTETAFARFFEGTSLTHSELVAFAADPERALGWDRGEPSPGERCSLCGFPTHTFEPEPERLSPEVIVRIRQDLPGWDPAAGLCQQCADLYRSRSLQGRPDFPEAGRGE
jgi:hypothetical protein